MKLKATTHAAPTPDYASGAGADATEVLDAYGAAHQRALDLVDEICRWLDDLPAPDGDVPVTDDDMAHHTQTLDELAHRLSLAAGFLTANTRR